MSGRLVRIRGKVQGVWYRAWTVQEATRRGLRGWVRNRRDGSVEALAAGEAAAVEALIRWAHQGSDGARVDAVDVSDAATHGVPEGFEQRETA